WGCVSGSGRSASGVACGQAGARQWSRLVWRSRTVMRSFLRARWLSAARAFQRSGLVRNRRARRAGELLNSLVDTVADLAQGLRKTRFQPELVLRKRARGNSLPQGPPTAAPPRADRRGPRGP